jgi:hypothetical protein
MNSNPEFIPDWIIPNFEIDRSQVYLPNQWGDPPALPVRQQKFDNFGSFLHSLVPWIKKAVHLHEHVNDNGRVNVSDSQ